MLSIDPNSKSNQENYKFLTGTIIPRPIAFVTSESSERVLNAAPFSYFNIVSPYPPMISISVQRKEGVQKDTARNILEKREFVVHIVDETNVDLVNQTAASLPPDESEVELAGLTPTESEKISVSGLKEAKVRMECVLEQSLDLEGSDLIIGRVVQYHIDEAIYEDGKTDPHGLAAVSRLAGASYAKLGELFQKKRPK